MQACYISPILDRVDCKGAFYQYATRMCIPGWDRTNYLPATLPSILLTVSSLTPMNFYRFFNTSSKNNTISAPFQDIQKIAFANS